MNDFTGLRERTLADLADLKRTQLAEERSVPAQEIPGDDIDAAVHTDLLGAMAMLRTLEDQRRAAGEGGVADALADVAGKFREVFLGGDDGS